MNLEDTLHAAIKELKKGRRPAEIAREFPEFKKEIIPLLETALQLSSLPKKQIPAPTMQRKFLSMPAKARAWYAWTSVMRWSAVSMAVMLFATGALGTAYGAMKSLPGQALFPLKKTAEQIHLRFTTDPLAKANIQVELAQKRLAEAQAVFDKHDKNPNQEIAALNELSSQTTEAVSTVRIATVTNNQASRSNHPIVNSLADVTSKQQTLLNQVKSQSGISAAANNALAANKEAKKFIAIIAATNEAATLTDPVSGQAEITIVGTVTAISTSTVTLEKIVFKISKDTVIKDLDDNVLAIADITPHTLLRVLGLKNSGGVTAKQIIIIGTDAEEQVKGESTTTPASSLISTTSTTPSIKKPELIKEPLAPKATTTPDPNSATGSFIPEDPRPQFAP